jgi:RNA polymerase sigma factor (sigma-70 family)
MIGDAELLRRYAEENSEAAFAELVQRHLNLVYFAALRQVGDPHRAGDITQAIFTDLARKAQVLSRRPVLTSWLHTSTRFTAAKLRRSEHRRRRYEQEAETMNSLLRDETTNAEWERLRPLIDDTLHELSERDRDAVLLRFFEGRPFAEVGEALKISEDAARMRVERALERLRVGLEGRGVTSTGSALAVALATQTSAAVPVGLAAAVTSGALAAAATGAAGLVASATAFMGMSKFGFGVAGVAVLAGTFGLAISERRARRVAEASVAAASHDYERSHARLVALERTAQVAEPTSLQAKPADNLGSNQTSTGAAVAHETEAINELVRSNAKAAGDLFLARHPAVKQAFLDWEAATLNTSCLPLYRALNLSPAQIEQFQVLHRGESRLHMETQSQIMGDGITDVDEAIELSVSSGLERHEVEARLRELLGADGYRTYLEFQRTRGAREYAASLAEALCFSPTPLTADQARQMVRIIDQNSTRETTRLSKFDWNAISTAANGILSSDQLAALDLVRAEDRYMQALNQERGSAGPPTP